MHFLKILVMAVLTVFLFAPAAKAELHSDTVILNHAEYVDIRRSLSRGGVLYPIYYTSKEDLYAYPISIACEMSNTYYDDMFPLLEEQYKDYELKATLYKDLGVTIYETRHPYALKDIYRDLDALAMHSYCQLNGVTNHPDMGLTYVVPIPGETSPAGNQMTWFTKFDRMLTTFPSSFTPKK